MVRWYFYILYEIKNISLLLKVYSYSLPKGEQNILIKNVKINYYISTNYCQVKKKKQWTCQQGFVFKEISLMHFWRIDF